jgi:hypothetical protein
VTRIERSNTPELKTLLAPEAPAQAGAALPGAPVPATEEPPRSAAAGGSSR